MRRLTSDLILPCRQEQRYQNRQVDKIFWPFMQIGRTRKPVRSSTWFFLGFSPSLFTSFSRPRAIWPRSMTRWESKQIKEEWHNSPSKAGGERNLTRTLLKSSKIPPKFYLVVTHHLLLCLCWNTDGQNSKKLVSIILGKKVLVS